MPLNEKPKLRLYDTMTRQKRDFVPIDEANVRLYVCGPTVYDFAHIGNARPAIVFDVLFRLLRHRYGPGHVTYVRNITDVDDKIIERARRDFPNMALNAAIREVTETTNDQYQRDVKALGCLEPDFQPRATEHIEGMVALVGELLAKSHAYEAGGEVLFDISSMADYGRLAGRKIDEQRAGARVAVEAHKRNPGDFVLWKSSSTEEPGWDSPWGRGRPGWHLECSVMSEHHLGQTFDIHGGGLDLIFPHHENEIAQSRCAHGTKTMANYWLHNGYLQVEGRKMSKSEGNFITIRDLLETKKFGGRKWPGEVLRLAMLMTHYRQPIDFSFEKLTAAEKTLNHWYRLIGDGTPAASDAPGADVVRALGDDLNSCEAINQLHLVADRAGGADEGGGDLKGAANLLGILTGTAKEWFQGEGAEGGDVQTRIDERLEALGSKDFAKADEIRDELASRGIQLMDSKDPETGERRTVWEIKR